LAEATATGIRLDVVGVAEGQEIADRAEREGRLLADCLRVLHYAGVLGETRRPAGEPGASDH
ncbi:MAG: hypothetical protein QOI98_1143, partial [Solirubrobacteraceae bacterium]|nr:hypothetical protein [Solirubrobacteraceae bacterium]